MKYIRTLKQSAVMMNWLRQLVLLGLVLCGNQISSIEKLTSALNAAAHTCAAIVN